jgi:glyoxylase-like metal-dependent hydrolase (beta-lactamase superfamily II)
MKVSEIGTRGVLFTFYELDGYPTNVYVIRGMTHTFICDTFLGPESMEKLIHYLHSHYEVRPYVVFNSHYHWDHIWGNCAFTSAWIIAHTACNKLIEEHGRKELTAHGEYLTGEVELILPGLTFSERLIFRNEEVEFFYSPGHTLDSATCFDQKDRILFTGDNVESPIPYVFSQDLTAYGVTLEHYLNMEYDVLIPGHGPLPQKTLIAENLAYITALAHHDTKKYEQKPYRAIHNINMTLLS